MDGPRTMKEALYREMIGDLSGILDRIEAMRTELPGQEEALRKAGIDAAAAIQAASEKGVAELRHTVGGAVPAIHKTVEGGVQIAVKAALAGSLMEDISRAARSAIVGRHLGNSMLSLWGGAMALALFTLLGYGLGSHIFQALQTHSITLRDFWSEAGWQSALAASFPCFFLFGAVEFEHGRHTWWQWLSLLYGAGGAILVLLLAGGWIST